MTNEELAKLGEKLLEEGVYISIYTPDKGLVYSIRCLGDERYEEFLQFDLDVIDSDKLWILCFDNPEAVYARVEGMNDSVIYKDDFENETFETVLKRAEELINKPDTEIRTKHWRW